MIKLINSRFILFTISALILLISCQSEHPHYTISGSLENIDTENPLVILSHFNPINQKNTAIDTAFVDDDGYFSLTYNWSQPDLYRISFPGRQSQILAIDKGQKKIIINAEGKRNGSIEIEGSEDSNKIIAYDKFRIASNERLIKPAYDKMKAAGNAGDIETEVDAVLEYVQNSKIHRKELLDFTEQNIGNSIALYGTVIRWTGDDEVNRLDILVKNFANNYPDLDMTKQMQDKVERFKKVAIGAKAPALEGRDENGEQNTLSASMGKYTLIDFWASWCGPCISQLPDLHEAYEKYHDRGFEIVSISVDRDEKKWTDSIEKLNLTWKHISDVKGWQSELAKAYNVTFIPFNLLIDENGIIVDKNLHSKALQNTLQELFQPEQS